MEGEKERQRQQGEEKESNEAEDDKRSDDDADDEEEDDGSDGTAWQESFDQDNLGLPIMHWEALSLRIAELEKQEEEKKAKGETSMEKNRNPVIRTEDRGRRAESWEDGNDACNSHVLALTSRLQTQMNLQLCFINNSESEEEEEKGGGSESWGTATPAQKNQQHPAKAGKSRGFRNALRNLRDRLRPDHKTPAAVHREPEVLRKPLNLSDLQNFTVEQLNKHSSSLSRTIQDLSAELVGLLHIRDQLRTEQDAMLLEIQDLTSL